MSLTNSENGEAGWETRSQTRQFADDHLDVVIEEVKGPSRLEFKKWTTVRRKNAIVVAAATMAGKFLLVRQERISVRQALWEMPAGQIDEANPSPEQIAATALRELREETGHQLTPDGELTGLGHFFASPGFTDECEHLFLARPVEPCAECHRDGESVVECRAFSVTELHRMIASNEIRDANTLSMCARLVARGLLAFEIR